MLRITKLEGARVLAFVLLAPLAACSSGPRTQLDWNVTDSYHHTRAAHVAYHHEQRYADTTPYRYTDATPYYHRADATPKPRSKPAWYSEGELAPAQSTPILQTAQYDSSQQQFAWPISGRVISDFGTSQSGERNDGINIAATFGEPIRAAASGSVTYAGNELKGYGNLVLIRHDDGYVTAYAHAQSILVNRGDRVLKGQVIGYAGDTGDVTSPQLHFEIRRGVQPVNPRLLMVASRT